MTERENLAGYCRTCTDAQLRNVYNDERRRSKAHGTDTEVGRTAEIFAEEAKAEMRRRGL